MAEPNDQQIELVNDNTEKPARTKMYQVVFQYTRATGGFEGVRIRMSFRDKKHFEEYYDQEERKTMTVVEKDVTDARAEQLIKDVPRACRIAACYEEALNRETGLIDPFILELKLVNVAMLEHYFEQDSTIDVESEEVAEKRQLKGKVGLLPIGEEE